MTAITTNNGDLLLPWKKDLDEDQASEFPDQLREDDGPDAPSSEEFSSSSWDDEADASSRDDEADASSSSSWDREADAPSSSFRGPEANAEGNPESPDEVREPTQERQRASLPRRIISWFVTLVILAGLALGVVLAVVPALNRGAALNVLTGSMSPTIEPGDIAVVFAIDSFDDVKIGDIVTFMPKPDDPTMVTHRAVGWTTGIDGERLLITKGDANNTNDEPIKEKQIRAKLAYVVPWLGNILQYSDFSKPILLVIAAIILIAYALYAVLSTIRR